MENTETTDPQLVSERIESVINALFGVYGRLRLKEEKNQKPKTDLLDNWVEKSVGLTLHKSQLNELLKSKKFNELDITLAALEQSLRNLIELESNNYSEIYAG